MKKLIALLLIVGSVAQSQTITETFGSGENQFSIDFVEIGNPGNAPDTTGLPNPVGSVGYIYNLGKYEISRGMIEKANTAGALRLSLANMTNYGGNGENRPATGINWLEAAKFVNWLNTSTGNSVAYKIGIYIDGYGNSYDEVQLWASNESGFDPNNKIRNGLAKYFLPTSSEWYKGAYGSPSGHWFNYPTGSDNPPTAVSSGTLPDTAVYGQQVGPSDITQAGGLSAWGTMAQGGNVREWTESAQPGSPDFPWGFKMVRGGNYSFSVDYMESSSPALGGIDGDPYADPITSVDVGFRIAMVPEPSSLSLLLAGGAVLTVGRRRKSD